MEPMGTRHLKLCPPFIQRERAGAFINATVAMQHTNILLNARPVILAAMLLLALQRLLWLLNRGTLTD